jgi:chemotaxis protein CheX
MSDFKAEEKDGILTVILPEVVDSKDSALEALIKSWLLTSATTHVLDFSLVSSLKQAAYRPFVLYNQSLKSGGKAMFALGMSQRLLAQVKSDGLTSVFVPVATIEEAKRRSRGGDRVTVDVEFINPFIAATRNVLETQAQTKLQPGKAYLKKQNEQIPMEIAGVISLVCSDFRGSITICFRAATFLRIYENMVGEKHEQITAEMEDAAGELLNIIFGQAKTVLNDQKGYTLEKALPTVLVGEKLKLHHQSRYPAIVLPFESAVGAFHIEIVVDRG